MCAYLFIFWCTVRHSVLQSALSSGTFVLINLLSGSLLVVDCQATVRRRGRVGRQLKADQAQTVLVARRRSRDVSVPCDRETDTARRLSGAVRPDGAANVYSADQTLQPSFRTQAVEQLLRDWRSRLVWLTEVTAVSACRR